MREGFSGRRVTFAPSGRSASSIALEIAAGAPMVPASPAPFTPSGLSGLGVTRCTVSIAGTSQADGSR